MQQRLKSFKDLKVWQKAMELAILVYKLTEKFPQSEQYGLVSQMRRAAISVSSNIAEGFKRFHKKEKKQFYAIAYASLAELESQSEVALRLSFLSREDYQELISLIVEVSKMLEGLLKTLNSSARGGSSSGGKSYILNPSPGQILVEAVVALSVLTVGFLGMATLLARALSLNRVIADNYTATYLAAEGIEVVKNIVDGNLRKGEAWDQGMDECSFEVDYASYTQGGCKSAFRKLSYNASTKAYSYSGPGDTPFERRLTVDFIEANEMRVTTEVLWTTRGGGRSRVVVEDRFYNRKP